MLLLHQHCHWTLDPNFFSTDIHTSGRTGRKHLGNYGISLLGLGIYAKLGHRGSEYGQSLLLFVVKVLLSTVECSLLNHSFSIYRHSVATGEA